MENLYRTNQHLTTNINKSMWCEICIAILAVATMFFPVYMLTIMAHSAPGLANREQSFWFTLAAVLGLVATLAFIGAFVVRKIYNILINRTN